jgi:cytochrome c oxidase assembly protein subunit 15
MVRVVCWVLLGVVCLMMTIGTLVTGTGPLAGASSAPRYHFLSLTAVTQLHADVGWALGVLTIGLLLMLILVQAPPRPVRLCWIVLGLIGLQGVVGYTQYFLHLPAGLVWVHVANTALIWVSVVLLAFSMRERSRAEAPAPAGLPGPVSGQVAGQVPGPIAG